MNIKNICLLLSLLALGEASTPRRSPRIQAKVKAANDPPAEEEPIQPVAAVNQAGPSKSRKSAKKFQVPYQPAIAEEEEEEKEMTPELPAQEKGKEVQKQEDETIVIDDELTVPHIENIDSELQGATKEVATSETQPAEQVAESNPTENRPEEESVEKVEEKSEQQEVSPAAETVQAVQNAETVEVAEGEKTENQGESSQADNASEKPEESSTPQTNGNELVIETEAEKPKEEEQVAPETTLEVEGEKLNAQGETPAQKDQPEETQSNVNAAVEPTTNEINQIEQPKGEVQVQVEQEQEKVEQFQAQTEQQQVQDQTQTEQQQVDGKLNAETPSVLLDSSNQPIIAVPETPALAAQAENGQVPEKQTEETPEDDKEEKEPKKSGEEQQSGAESIPIYRNMKYVLPAAGVLALVIIAIAVFAVSSSGAASTILPK